MKLKAKRVAVIILLFGGIIWDCLCILNVVPLAYFTLSIIVIGGYAMGIAFLQLLFPIVETNEKSQAFSELTSKEKSLSGMTISLLIAWLITLTACIVFPL